MEKILWIGYNDMGLKKIRTRTEDISAAYAYLKKAEDNYAAMVTALADNNYNAVGTLAMQCVISSADAICVYKKGERSISQDHKDICSLIEAIALKDARDKSAGLRRIIAKKNTIQYECRSVYEAEAHDLAKAAKRMFEWVSINIKDK